MKFLFVGDPIEQLKPKGDSSLVFVRQALARKHEVYWTTDTGIEWNEREVFVTVDRCIECNLGELPKMGGAKAFPINEMDGVWIRKDPPFDDSYVRLCWMLGLAENKVWMFNRPSVLLRYHEKLISMEAMVQGFLKESDIIPTHIGRSQPAIDFIKRTKSEKTVEKPFFGYAGKEVRLIDSKVFCQRDRVEEVSWALIQPFQKAVLTEGDRRVFLLEGELLGHFARIPKAGQFVSNLAQGGTALKSPLSDQEVEVLKRLGSFLKAAKIELAGADLIGGKVSEVNITSPTGLANLIDLESRDYSIEIMDFAEAQVEKFKSDK